MLRTNFLKEKLNSGKIVIGTWSVIPSIVVSDIIASSGMDFIIIDSEHGPITFETAQNMIIACESRGVSPIIRVSGINDADILKALDIGAHCLHIPNITNKKDVEMCIKLVKYPPIGKRGFSPFTRAGNYSIKHAKELTSKANDSVMLAIHIEGKEAVDNIDEILEIKGVDIVFVGLFDISKSLGIPGQVDNPEVINLLKKIVEKTNKAGKYPGTIVNDESKLKEFISYGVKYITYSVDCNIISKSYKQIYEKFKGVIDGQ